MIFDATYDSESISGIIESIFAEFPLDLKGKTVLVKPNILAAEPPEKGVTTHPALVKAVTEKLKKQGAKVMVGDNPGAYEYGMSDNAARISKVMEAAGDTFILLNQNPVKQSIQSSDIKEVLIAKEVLQADLVINLPKLKTHALTFYTGAIKNTFGYVVGGGKMRIHSKAVTPRRFAEALVHIFAIRPPELTIMDAIDVMEGNGPHHGTVRTLGKIIASDNAVSLDAVALHLVGKKPSAIPHVALAADKGLGTIDLSEINLNRKIIPLTDFKMPPTFVTGIIGVFLNRLVSRWINCTPVTRDDLCQRCGICVNQCPVDAIKMEGQNFPRADKKICISCYCCQELCPEDAIILKGLVINLLHTEHSSKK